MERLKRLMRSRQRRYAQERLAEIQKQIDSLVQFIDALEKEDYEENS